MKEAAFKYTQGISRGFFFLLIVGFCSSLTFASGGGKEQKISDVIVHHIKDNHDWHFFDVGETAVALHLPWILYNTEGGLEFYGSTHSLEENPNYIVHHDKVYHVASKEPVMTFTEQVTDAEAGSHEGVEEEGGHDHGAHGGHDSHGVSHGVSHGGSLEEIHAYEGKEGYVVLHETYIERHGDEKMEMVTYKVYKTKEGAVLDFSMTKTGLQILLVAILMFFVFTAAARGYKKNEGKAPKGIQSFMEPIIIFVREDVAKPFLHGKHDRFMPYLLTLFFFIWISNMFGLTPLNSNIAGNTTITIMLALLSFILILFNSTKDFWAHIFWFPGVPVPIKFLMLVVELIGLISKPAALAIRLFANISAGHFMVLSLISLIFILGDMGHSPTGAWAITPLSLLFGLFIMLVEIIVAAVQAFVFAMLTAVFIGQAMETHGHDDHH